ncbi:MAG TPA: histidine phosphatase family protein [Dehalococcoidia bacterium]|nr:histidine phosphatase family protein [Dehalococcoidia bacterium]
MTDLSSTLNGRLLLVRHARTHDNIAERLAGWTDSVIHEESLIAAEQVAAFLRDNYQIDYLYCSPLQRARITAGIIGLAIRQEPIEDEGLKEMHFGIAEGLTKEEFAAAHPEVHAAWQAAVGDLSFAWPKGESRTDFQERIKTTINRLVGQHPGQTVLAVSHGGAIGGYVAFTCDRGLEVWSKYQPDNCSVTEIVFTDGRAELIRFNDTSFLTHETTLPLATEAEAESRLG